ncbi:hypothetical protein [Cupriavidus sp. IK-TO18]|uniref:hypothetical protein n=1 Tax=Pseudomonadota TaxID=1224 RepID=UPI00189B83CE|nr:hypothetical protein [Cupriavidus sp. IK-TO18]MBF6992729.1 hypothetical protein [Cupriavidus sp. IK-TO18]
MQVFNFRILPWSGGQDARRLERLQRLLDEIGTEISTEKDTLGDQYENATTNAAFAFEAMENGEGPEWTSRKIDALTASVTRYSQRLRSLKHEADFIEATKQRVALLLGARDRL